MFYIYIYIYIYCLTGSFGFDLSFNLRVVGESPSDAPEGEVFLETLEDADYEWGSGDIA